MCLYSSWDFLLVETRDVVGVVVGGVAVVVGVGVVVVGGGGVVGVVVVGVLSM